MLKYADILRLLRQQIVDRSFVRPVGDGAEAEAGLDLIMETISVGSQGSPIPVPIGTAPRSSMRGIIDTTNTERYFKSKDIKASVKYVKF